MSNESFYHIVLHTHRENDEEKKKHDFMQFSDGQYRSTDLSAAKELQSKLEFLTNPLDGYRFNQAGMDWYKTPEGSAFLRKRDDAYQAAPDGEVKEIPYLDWWHMFCDTHEFVNDCWITINWQDIYDGCEEDWQRDLLAAYCTLKFNHFASLRLGGHGGEPIFDCRAFVVPTIKEAYHAFLWRQQDATKNAISMAAHAHFSHKSLQGMHGPEMQERLFQEKGINFNDYPAFFKRGVFAKRVKVERLMTEDEMRHIPEQHRPTGPILRTELQVKDLWLSKEDDPVEALFG